MDQLDPPSRLCRKIIFPEIFKGHILYVGEDPKFGRTHAIARILKVVIARRLNIRGSILKRF